MASITSIIENISEQFVYSSGERKVTENFETYNDMGQGEISAFSEVSNPIYGIGDTYFNNRLALAVYHKPAYDPARIRRVLNSMNIPFPLVLSPTQTVESQLGTGDAISHVALYRRGGYGTLGGFAMDAKSKYLLMISNNHVLANCNNCANGDSIYDYVAGTQCGNLHRYVPLMLPPQTNLVDAAAATILKGKRTESFQTPIQANARYGMRVYKIGATSGLTYGTVVSTYSTARVNYGASGVFNFRDVLTIVGDYGAPFSEPGDSGSFVYNANGHVVGMIFAGERYNKNFNWGAPVKSFACKINHVVNSLSLRFG